MLDPLCIFCLNTQNLIVGLEILSEQTTIISLNSIRQLIFVMDTRSVICDADTSFLKIILTTSVLKMGLNKNTNHNH